MIIVTGGSGFIGSHLIESLLHDGHEVLNIDDLSAGALANTTHFHGNPRYTFARVDISDYDSLYELLALYTCPIEAIYHLACSKMRACASNPHRDLVVNAGGTLNLLMLAELFGISRFIHASTGSVYGEHDMAYEYMDEKHPLRPTNYYGVSKLAGERYVDIYGRCGLDTTILRFFHVYGPRQKYGDDVGAVVCAFMRMALTGQPLRIFGSGNQKRSFTWVGDLVNVCKLVLNGKQTYGQVYNVASGNHITINGLAGLVSKVVGVSNHVKYSDEREVQHVYFNVDNYKVEHELECTFPTPLEEGLQHVKDWMEQELGQKV